MPRIKNKDYQRRYQVTDIYNFIDAEMRAQKVTQERAGKEMGCTQATVSKNIKKQSLSTIELVSIIDLLGYKLEIVKKE